MDGLRWSAAAFLLLACDGASDASTGDVADAATDAVGVLDAAAADDASTSDAANDAASDGAPTIDPCPERVALDGGVACAIPPSLTTSGITDTFGHHAVGIPQSVTPTTPLYIFFRGTGAKPFDPESKQYPTSALRVLQEAIDRGRLALMIAYDNLWTPQELCGNDLACYAAVRREIIEGIEAGDPGDLKHVRPPNDVMSRIAALVAHLRAVDANRFPASVDWPSARLGGGSQGGGHAIFIAKELRTVAWACNLAGLGDSNDTGDPATWLTSSTWMTPLARMRSVIHAEDPSFTRATTVWTAFGFELDVSWRKLTAATTDPHAFPLAADATATSARLWACFDP